MANDKSQNRKGNRESNQGARDNFVLMSHYTALAVFILITTHFIPPVFLLYLIHTRISTFKPKD
jgi:hypothetical protein